MELPRMELPHIVKIRQALPPDHIGDIAGELHRSLAAAGLGDKLKAGQRVAVTAGSRGMGCFSTILRAIVAEVQACGAEPFLTPTMGSHGGATAEGQVGILNGYGITEETIGCPIRATMDTVCLGRTANGAEVHYGQYAYEADATIVVGRCKTHPILHEGNGSGLLKMTTIGLGKQKGAQEAHAHGLSESVQQAPKVALAKGNVILGVNVVENGYRQPYHIEVVAPQDFWDSDHRCLELARAFVARVPFEELDVLVISFIGKNISGGGMDPNITGFWRAEGEGARVPDFKRIVVLDLTEETQGNALGVGQADFTTRRLVEKIDHAATTINMLTATSRTGRLIEAAVPIALDTDREAIEVALRAAVPAGAPRVCWIKNTDELGELWVSEALLPEARQNPRLEVLGEPGPWPFNTTGNTDWR
ncbi:MAG: DUF362 domain-containing protein [Chloroflexota bacterium]|nr:DUF362 domain-containing protein [Chloroflexota bacterium]